MEIMELFILLRVVVAFVAMLLLPGWAMLAFGDMWRLWDGLQRWIVAVGLSIAFYPVLFYITRLLIPFLTFGPYKTSAMLAFFAGIIVWRMRDCWKQQIVFDRMEWIALGIFGMTLFTRFWVIRDYPYPAWSDSLHHVILTQLTAVQGQLPVTMEPYFPISLDQYHLGLYSLAAVTQWLARVPAHTALLWIAQLLNGLCGLGAYLVLDRKVGRVGAIVGAVVVGLLAHQPAWYVNWGRFTQISSQTILLVAWLVTWEAIKAWKLPWQVYRVNVFWNTAFAALLTAAVFLLHFRVAGFYLPLLAMSIAWELWRAGEGKVRAHIMLGVITVGVMALVLIAPVLWKATNVYVSMQTKSGAASEVELDASEITETVQRYYEFSWRSLPRLATHTWLMVLAGIGAVVGVAKREKLTIFALVWVVVLYFLGQAYLLGIPLLNFTNLGAVLIMLYLPVGLIIGSAAELFLSFCHPHWRRRVVDLIVALVFTGGFIASHIRVTDIEPYRYFVTSADVEAMRWINENTPEDALFAVNTYFWLPRAPHGTDGGYWIPYFTGRRTTVGTMLNYLGEEEYTHKVVKLSQAVEELEKTNDALRTLQSLSVDYIYVGKKGDFSGPGLSGTQLSQASGVSIVYQSDLVYILQIKP